MLFDAVAHNSWVVGDGQGSSSNVSSDKGSVITNLRTVIDKLTVYFRVAEYGWQISQDSLIPLLVQPMLGDG
jgi:hypothetical protein